jgi:hypothetical protein
MNESIINCPKCGVRIELTEALTSQIESVIRTKYEAEMTKRAAEIEMQKQALEKQRKEVEAKEQSVAEQVADQLKAERKKISEEKKALDAQRQRIEDELAEREKELRGTLTKQLKVKLAEEQAEEKKALEEELEEKTKKVSELQKREIELRREKRSLEQKKQEMEIENQRTLDAERKKITEDATKAAAEDQMLKIREKDDLIRSMQQQIEALRRKAETGSQERQGEALEGTLQDTLQQAFSFDGFEEIKKGQRGADILQIVRNNNGRECGKILWESKNTKDFSNKWIEKIKTDQQQASADIAVIMSIALPKEINNFGVYEGIWITDYKSTIGLCTAIRETLVRVEREKVVTQHQESMKDVVYQYITGQEFSMRVKRIADAYIGMQRDLDSEKLAMSKIWNKREKQIATVLDNLTGMRGEIEGIVGGQKLLPSIETLSLEGIVSEDEKEEH